MKINKLIKLIEAEYKKNKQERVVLDGAELQKIELYEIERKEKSYINLNCEMQTNYNYYNFTTQTFLNRLKEIKRAYGNLKICSNEYRIYRVSNVNGLLNMDTFKYARFAEMDIKDITTK